MKKSFLWVFFKKILWVLNKKSSLSQSKKVKFFESDSKKRFNSMIHLRVQFFESLFSHKKVPFPGHKVQFFELHWKVQLFESFLLSEKKGSILWVVFRKKVQFWESYSKEGSILRVIYQMGSLHSDILKRSSILWVIFSEKKSILLSHVQKKVHFFESYSQKKFTSLSHIRKKQILWVIFKK